MKKFLTPLLGAALFTLFATGCSSTNTLMVGLKTELTGIARAGDGTVQVSWRVVNPNIVSYLVAEADQRIYLDGVLVGTSKDREPVAVPAQSKTDRTSALVPAGAAAERTLAAALKAGSAAYRLESSVTIRLYGDTTEKSTLTASGTVPVTAR